MSSTQPSYDPEWADRPAGFSRASHAQGSGVTRVSVSGDLDLATAPQLTDALAEVPDGTALVILDLSEVTFMDSSGLQVILAARARLADADCRFVLVRGGQQVQRIFEITGTEDHLEFIGASDARGLAAVQSR